MRTRSWRWASIMLVLAAGLAGAAPTAAAKGGNGKGGGGPAGGLPDGPAWVVTMGDSAISGEAGRWAGNANDSPSRTDTGADAYFDNASGTAEAIPGCHRSQAAEVHIGIPGVLDVNSLNLACSGARTDTQTGGNFKPGFDWYDGPEGRSQVVELQEFARSNRVEAVVVLVGANNYGFADIVQACVTNWVTSPSWWKNYCSDDADIAGRFTPASIDARTDEVAGALNNVAQAMRNAGYGAGDYTIVVQTYWSPVPRGNQFRYAESGWSRLDTGGCGMWNRDADWANDTVVAAMNYSLTEGARRARLRNHVVLDLSSSLHGHRLCEQGVDLVENTVGTWTAPGATDVSEWVSQIRTLTTVFGPYQIQESLHANYWGQLAMRNCLRQAYADGAVRGGTCTSADGVNAQGEPNMVLA